MAAGPVIPDEVGVVYDVGVVSPTYGSMGLFVKPGTYTKEQQLIKRQDVVAALSQAIADRDINFWTRQSQFDWSKGQDQDFFDDAARFKDGRGIDIHKRGSFSLVPMPSVVTSAAVDNGGRGAALAITALPNGSAAIFFPWSDGNYAYSTNGGATWATSTTPVGARITDIATNGSQAFFVFGNQGGVWQTNTAAPVALTQYDTGGNKYARLVYDPLRKTLYGILTADQGVALHKINSGAGATVIFDWVIGRLDGLEIYQGNVVVSWNTASYTRGANASKLYKYDGTNTTFFADMPDGGFVVSMRVVLGFLFILAYESDPFAPVTDKAGLYTIVGGTGPTRVASVDASYNDDLTSGAANAYPHFMFGQGTGLYICTQQRTMRYDIVTGGISRSFGDDGGAVGNVWLQGAVAVRGTIFAIAALKGTAATGVVKLNPSGAGGLISVSGDVGQRITGSRIDLGLPYVDKYWYGIEVAGEPLIAGQTVKAEYSLNDGATFTACSNSPWNTVGEKRRTFLVQQVNPHIVYRITLVSGVGVASPIIHAVSVRFAPSNPNAHVWRLTTQALDDIRARNNRVMDSTYGEDILAFLHNIAQKSELITFYELDDDSRTAHSVWVLTVQQSSPMTGNTYSPIRAEGEVDLILWEAVAA